MLTPERGTLTAVIVRRSQGKRQSTLILREMGWLFRSFQGLQALIQLLLDQVPLILRLNRRGYRVAALDGISSAVWFCRVGFVCLNLLRGGQLNLGAFQTGAGVTSAAGKHIRDIF